MCMECLVLQSKFVSATTDYFDCAMFKNSCRAEDVNNLFKVEIQCFLFSHVVLFLVFKIF